MEHRLTAALWPDGSLVMVSSSLGPQRCQCDSRVPRLRRGWGVAAAERYRRVPGGPRVYDELAVAALASVAAPPPSPAPTAPVTAFAATLRLAAALPVRFDVDDDRLSRLQPALDPGADEFL